MLTKTRERSSMTTLEDALKRINKDPCSMAEIDGVISDQGLNIKIPKGAGLENSRQQVREALEKASGNGDPKSNGSNGVPDVADDGDKPVAEPKASSNGNPATTAKVNGDSGLAEPIPVEVATEKQPFTDQAAADMEGIDASLEQEAADLERLEAELTRHNQQELEAYRRTSQKADEVNARKEQAQFRMLGALAGAQMERNRIDAEIAATGVATGAVSSFLQGVSLFRRGSDQESLAEHVRKALPAGKGVGDEKGE